MASGARHAMNDWQRELNQIIKQTERNLHGRTEPNYVPLGRSSLVALGGFGSTRTYGGLSGGLGGALGGPAVLGASAGGQENSAPRADALGGSSQPGGAASASVDGHERRLSELLHELGGSAHALQAEELRGQQSAFKEAFSRVLDGLKFELDMRASLATKAMEATREEMGHALAATERRALDASRELEAGLQAKLAAEREQRLGAELGLEALRASVAQGQQDVNRSLGELQDMVISQREACRGLESELLSARLHTEARLAEDGRRMDHLQQLVQAVADEFDALGSGGGGGGPSVSQRLGEVELALLNERELRKMVEIEVGALKQTRAELRAELDERLAPTRAAHEGVGGGVSVRARSPEYEAVDGKVKECARLIVRMGSELVEETRRRQALDEQLAELRARLAALEATHGSARAPGGSCAAPGGYGGEHDGGYGSPGGARGSAPSNIRSVAPSPPEAHFAAGPYYQSQQQRPSAASCCAPSPAPVGGAGAAHAGGPGGTSALAVAARMLGAAPGGAEACEATTWPDETSEAVDAQMRRRGLVETPHVEGRGGARRSLDGAAAQPLGGGNSRRSSVGSLSSAAVEERVRAILSRSNPTLPTMRSTGGRPGEVGSGGSMTREQLDARVQQILGRHSTGSAAGSGV